MKRAVLILLLLSGATFWLSGKPHWPSIPGNFFYQVDLRSLDQLYDESKQQFSSQEHSISRFTYQVVDHRGRDLVIRNTFDVRTMTGEEIFSVDRLYGVDRVTGQHKSNLGDRTRSGYLFAPRHLRFGEPFTYWHINYDGPAEMKFVKAEIINGLNVYQYQTSYEGVRIDQTSNLLALPGVGITRGIELEPNLQVWVEPLTGHLIKYQDDTVAYFYDLASGNRLHPWNHFTNTYSADSVIEQVEIAKTKKHKAILLDFGIPTLLIVLVVIALVSHVSTKKRAIVVVTTGLLFLAGFLVRERINLAGEGVFTGQPQTLRIGVELGLLPTPVRIAKHNGYFAEQGIDLEITDYSSGRAALTAMLTEGKLDMATVAQTPVVLNSFSRDDYGVIAAMVSTTNDVKVVARRDRGINTAADLRSKNIGITAGSTGHYFLSLFLSQSGLSLDDVRTYDFPATELPETIAAGQVDAIATWEPNTYQAQELLGKNGITLESSGVYREDFYFAVFQDWIKENQDIAKRFLLAIDKAETYIAEHPRESQKIISQALKLDPVFLSSVWDDFSFRLFLDQAVLLTFEQQSRWLKANAIVESSATPNYLDYIYFSPLDAVRPEAITIIH